MAVKLTWYGHAAWGIDADGTKIVVDPFLKPNNPSAQVTAEELKADFILVTHGHGDHVADLVALAKQTGATVICNFEISVWLSRHGVDKVHAMNHGGAFTFPFGKIKMVNAIHSSMLPDGSNGGNPAGYVIQFNDGHDVYFAGDTALTYDMKLIGEFGGVDLAVLPVGDNFTMGPDDAMVAAQWVKAKHVLLSHYNTFPLIAIDGPAFAKKLRRDTGIECTVLAVGQTYELA